MSIERTTTPLSSLCAIALVLAMVWTGSVRAQNSTSQQDDALDPKLVHASLIDTVKVLNEVYVYPDTARRVGREMRKRLDEGRYEGITSTHEFADRIGADLRELSGDGHLDVLVVEDDAPPTHVMKEEIDRFRLNHAFEKVEVLGDNIGYLKLNKFFQDDEARVTADHAFGFLRGTDALILDLSECKGGSPELVAYMLSHFYSDRTLLWSIVDRDGVSVHDEFSTSGVGPARFKDDYPVLILTGPDTASAAELFTYTLKNHGIARTVGRRTMGIAHIVGAVPINQRFVGRFSTYRTINPRTNVDWEKAGITPDAPADPEHSLEVAVAMAKKSVTKTKGQ